VNRIAYFFYEISRIASVNCYTFPSISKKFWELGADSHHKRHNVIMVPYEYPLLDVRKNDIHVEPLKREPELYKRCEARVHVQVTVDVRLGLNWVEKLRRRVQVKQPEPCPSDAESSQSDSEPGPSGKEPGQS